MCGHDNPKCPGPPCPYAKAAYPGLSILIAGCTPRPQSPAIPRAVPLQETPIELYRRLAALI